MANMAGFYPPSGSQIWNADINWQPIPIHTLPVEQDPVINYCSHTMLIDQSCLDDLHATELSNFQTARR